MRSVPYPCRPPRQRLAHLADRHLRTAAKSYKELADPDCHYCDGEGLTVTVKKTDGRTVGSQERWRLCACTQRPVDPDPLVTMHDYTEDGDG